LIAVGLIHLWFKEIPESYVKAGKDLTPEKWREFVIKDNVGFGEWEFEDLVKNWDTDLLSEWGLDLPEKKLDENGNYEKEENIYDTPMQLIPEKEYILIICEKDEFEQAREHFKCGFVKKNNGAKDIIVKSRTISYKQYVDSNTEQKQTI